jgi:hypothetical protein
MPAPTQKGIPTGQAVCDSTDPSAAHACCVVESAQEA